MMNLLIVDDDKNLRTLLEQEFTDVGYKIATAADGNAALEYLEQQLPSLVVLDISMPGLDGIQVLKKIRERHRDLPVVLHSAYSTYIDNVCTLPANAYVVKSGDLSGLLEKVEELLPEKATVSASGEKLGVRSPSQNCELILKAEKKV